jgi:hypothetical protein
VADQIAPEYDRYVATQRREGRRAAAAGTLREGGVAEPLHVDPESASRLIAIAAKRASGLFLPTTRTEVVWIEGDSELAVGIAGLRVRTIDATVVVTIPVRCDQTGAAEVHVTFAVGTPERPAGLFASAQRRPRGPAVVVETWGDALVAFAWQCVLGLVTGLAAAVGKDARGNVLVPAELEASRGGLVIVPMARHRFTGSSGLRTRS